MAWAPAGRAADLPPVDLALVLAVDVSGSINDDNFRLQMGGYAAAFLDPMVIASITKSGGHGIAVTLVEWAGTKEQSQVVPWMLLKDKASCEKFAAQVKNAKRMFSDYTSISEGIDFSVGLLKNSGYNAARRVIDVSGDGSSNQGREVTLARDDAVKAGIVINGLPILVNYFDLKSYYRDNVIGGSGAFVESAENIDSFPQSIRYKIIKEISQAEPERTLKDSRLSRR